MCFHNNFLSEWKTLTFKAFSIPGTSEPKWSARQSGSTTTSSFNTENAPTWKCWQYDQIYHPKTMSHRIVEEQTFVLIDFSRNCLLIDLTTFGTSCFSNHRGLQIRTDWSTGTDHRACSLNAHFLAKHKKRKHVYTSTKQNNNRPFQVLIRMNEQTS